MFLRRPKVKKEPDTCFLLISRVLFTPDSVGLTLWGTPCRILRPIEQAWATTQYICMGWKGRYLWLGRKRMIGKVAYLFPYVDCWFWCSADVGRKGGRDGGSDCWVRGFCFVWWGWPGWVSFGWFFGAGWWLFVCFWLWSFWSDDLEYIFSFRREISLWFCACWVLIWFCIKCFAPPGWRDGDGCDGTVEKEQGIFDGMVCFFLAASWNIVCVRDGCEHFCPLRQGCGK